MLISAPNVNHNRAMVQLRELSNDDIILRAPAVATAQAHERTSARYNHYSTMAFSNVLREMGWVPFQARESRTREENRAGYQAHEIIYRPRDIEAMAVGDSIFNIVLRNAHDGTSSFQLEAAIYRLACSNGLRVKKNSLEMVRIRHTETPDVVVDAQAKLLTGFDGVAEDIRVFSAVKLDREQQKVFAEAAMALRWEGENESPIKADSLLIARRSEDMQPSNVPQLSWNRDRTAKDDLYTTMNVVQENLIKGGIRGRNAKGARTTTREVKGIDSSNAINRGLWILQSKMAELAASRA